ncbi:hypothetical protein C8E00_104470 [Chromohalobacter marismortui]|uniref:DUF3047 family protein n=1 Tax=Chromohalobacter marismortui TaxID=42055 RepID=A0A4R7NNY5_9GAMM|nr:MULTISPECIES: DUF3047 domain-containing protein [Chromohalobacter]MCI0509569.1 DUF3047 domain-containing protein [Chromohalobacter sp.]MCI0592537.1 DUF3047 domain-containing protein [Chromohalobacter sp.]TDU22289.1 hypothetical protein C8E00_104470 [Chromohalobacter marismortui]
MTTHRWMGRALALGGLVLSTGAPADEIAFSAQEMAAWETRAFEGQTRYTVVRDNGVEVLEANARGQASAKYLEREVDLSETPYLHWCWKVDTRYAGLEERTQAGDDYPARLYVARKTGLLPWQVQSVNYVWSSNQPIGARWPNAFTDRAMLLALQGEQSAVGDWRAQVRDVSADYQALFGEDVSEIDGVALMSDGDNAGGNATAWYYGVGFSDSPTPPNCPG